MPTSIFTIKPEITALVIIDMQNYFLSPALGRDPSGPGHAAMNTLLQSTIPAARKAGIRVVWLNWGVTEQDIDEMPAATLKGFGGLNAFRPEEEKKEQVNVEVERLVNTKPSRIYEGFGTPMGIVKVEDEAGGGEMETDAGRLLMPDQWNSSLPPALNKVYQEGLILESPSKPDVWIYKNRMSGMWNPSTPACQFLLKEGIKTLLFCGVNTDQCVGGTLVDAYNMGWDCILVRDGCGTGTPGGKDVTEWNVARSWGFVVDSEEVENGVEGMLKAREGKS